MQNQVRDDRLPPAMVSPLGPTPADPLGIPAAPATRPTPPASSSAERPRMAATERDLLRMISERLGWILFVLCLMLGFFAFAFCAGLLYVGPPR